MKKYIKEYNQEGHVIINIQKVIKDWNDNFYICFIPSIIPDGYKLIIKGKKENSISMTKQQSLELIEKLNLLEISFNVHGIFKTKQAIENDLKNLYLIKSNTNNYLLGLNHEIECYNKTLLKANK